MIQKLERSSGKVLGYKLSDKLHDADYKVLVPEVEAVIKSQGKVRMLAHFDSFHGWDLKAMWDDTKFAVRHFAEIERVALVGDKKWEEWMATVCKPFTRATVKYFDVAKIEEAWAWLEEGA